MLENDAEGYTGEGWAVKERQASGQVAVVSKFGK